MPKYTLMHFNVRKPVEIVRLVFAAAKEEFVDEPISLADWPMVKMETPTKQLPCLVIDGKMYSQSIPIAIYLATTFGLHGGTPEECLLINMIVETANDLSQAVDKAIFAEDHLIKAKQMETLKKVVIPKYLQMFDKFLRESGTGFFIKEKINGSLKDNMLRDCFRMTLADLMVFNVLADMLEILNDQSLLAAFPRLKVNFEKMGSYRAIKAWIQQRRQTPFQIQ